MGKQALERVHAQGTWLVAAGAAQQRRPLLTWVQARKLRPCAQPCSFDPAALLPLC